MPNLPSSPSSGRLDPSSIELKVSSCRGEFLRTFPVLAMNAVTSSGLYGGPAGAAGLTMPHLMACSCGWIYPTLAISVNAGSSPVDASGLAGAAFSSSPTTAGGSTAATAAPAAALFLGDRLGLLVLLSEALNATSPLSHAMRSLTDPLNGSGSSAAASVSTFSAAALAAAAAAALASSCCFLLASSSLE